MDGFGPPAAACCCFWKKTTVGYCYKNTLGVKDSQVEQRGEAENWDQIIREGLKDILTLTVRSALWRLRL